MGGVWKLRLKEEIRLRFSRQFGDTQESGKQSLEAGHRVGVPFQCSFVITAPRPWNLVLMDLSPAQD